MQMKEKRKVHGICLQDGKGWKPCLSFTLSVTEKGVNYGMDETLKCGITKHLMMTLKMSGLGEDQQ